MPKNSLKIAYKLPKNIWLALMGQNPFWACFTKFRQNFSLSSTFLSKNCNLQPVLGLRLDLSVLNSKTLVSEQKHTVKKSTVILLHNAA